MPTLTSTVCSLCVGTPPNREACDTSLLTRASTKKLIENRNFHVEFGRLRNQKRLRRGESQSPALGQKIDSAQNTVWKTFDQEFPPLNIPKTLGRGWRAPGAEANVGSTGHVEALALEVEEELSSSLRPTKRE